MLNGEDRGNRFVLSILIPGLLVLSAAGGKQVHYLIPLLAVLMLLVSRGLHDPGAALRRRHSLVPALVMSPLILPGLVGLIGNVGAATQALAASLSGLESLGSGSGRHRRAAVGPTESDDRSHTPGRREHRLLCDCGGRGPSDHSVPIRSRGRLAGTSGPQQSAGRPTAYVGNYQGEFTFFGRLRAPVTELKPAQATDWAAQNPNGLIVSRTKRLLLLGSPTPEYRQVYKGDELLMFRALDLSSTGSRVPQSARPGVTASS